MPLIERTIVEDTWETVTGHSEGRRVIATLDNGATTKTFRARQIPGIRLKSMNRRTSSPTISTARIVALEFPAFRPVLFRPAASGTPWLPGGFAPLVIRINTSSRPLRLRHGGNRKRRYRRWDAASNIRHWYQPTADGRRTIVRRRGDALGQTD